MLLLIPILLLTGTPLIMLILNRLPRPFRYSWLVAAAGVFLAWLGVWLLRLRLDAFLPIATWQPMELFTESPALAVDGYSWPFGMALATVALAVILTDIGRAEEAHWGTWSASLALTALGLIAVFSANLVTLLLAWTVIDVVEFFMLLPQQSDQRERRNLILFSATSLLGTLVVLWASVWTVMQGQVFSFEALPVSASIYLLLAIGLRMGVFPLNVLHIREPGLRRGLGTLLRLTSAAASLVLLARIALVGVPPQWQWLLMLFVLLAAWYAGFAWLRAADEIEGRPYWIVAVSALAFAATLRALPAAAIAWGVALLLVGGLAFLASSRDWRLAPVGVLGVLGLTALPLTAAYQASAMYALSFNIFAFAFLVPQALLMLGFVRHGLRASRTLEGVERWVWIIYPLGLALLPITQWLVTGWLLPDVPGAFGAWWPGVLAVLLAVGGYALSRVIQPVPDGALNVLQTIFSFGWAYSLAEYLFRLAARIYAIPVALFEGEGGLLWTLVFLALLFTLFAQFGIGV